MGSTMGKKAEGQATEDEDTTVVLDDELETGAGEGKVDGNTDEAQTGGADGQVADDEGGHDDVVVTIGEEPPPHEEEHAQAPEWVRELRKNYRELQRENRELKEKATAPATETNPEQLGKKPTLEDHDYDAEKFEVALTSWHEQKRKADDRRAKADAEVKAGQEAWQAKLGSYGKAKAELKVKDFDDAEATVQESLSVTQQGIILQGAENPALLIYALGKNPKKAKELASITDPVKYAFAVAKLETQLKVSPRKAPPPEKTLSGTGRVSGTVDSTLERLRADAEKTGDYTKVTQYKMQKRNAK